MAKRQNDGAGKMNAPYALQTQMQSHLIDIPTQPLVINQFRRPLEVEAVLQKNDHQISLATGYEQQRTDPLREHVGAPDGEQGAHWKENDSIRIDACHLKKVSSNQVVLLNDISLAIPRHTLVGLVGGSGTGKSTLMGALNGQRPVQEGKVLYNGRDYYRQRAEFRWQSGYVPQDDIVHQDLTAERALYYAAKLRLPADFTAEQIQQRIDTVLADVDMEAHRHLLIRKLSGGQRKRISIALELLAQPGIFFLDEPTSGLDPGLDYKMMHLLRRLADKGQTIVLATHATTNILLCDYICFLAQGGRLAYFGPPQEARSYFGKSDFTEIYRALEPSAEHPHAPEEAEARFKASPYYQKYIVALLDQAPAEIEQSLERSKSSVSRRHNGWQQFVFLCMRYLELFKNDSGSLLILLLQAPVIALLLVSLVKYETGTGTFEAKSIATCPTAEVLLTPGGLPIMPGPTHPLVATRCERVENFLKNDVQGKAYAARRGGVGAALRDFIAAGSGANAQKELFILSFTAVLFGCINAAREIVKEAPIYRRERAVNLGILPYMFSKIVVLAFLCLIQSVLLVGIVQLADGFQQGILFPAPLEVYITVALTSLAGLMMGLAVSVVAPSTDRAMSFVPLLLIPQVIFSGTVFPFKGWFTQLLAMLCAARWSIGALGSTVGLQSDKLGGDRLLGDRDIYQGTLFSIYERADALHYLLTTWLALGVMIVLLMGIVGICLKLKDAVRTY